MYYFVDEETYEVVLKKHQFNTELINGQISPLSSQEECYLIAHIPNTKRG